MVKVTQNKERKTVRHRLLHRDALEGISKASILHLARRAGVKRVSSPVYDETRNVLKQFLAEVLRHATLYCDHNKKKTVTASDVVRSFKHQGRTVYGYGE